MTIEEYLNTTIDTISNSLSDSEILRISDEISQKLCEYKNYYGERESLTNKIYSLLLEYNSNTIDKAKLIESINEETDLFISSVTTTSSEESYYSSSNYYNSSSNSNSSSSSSSSSNNSSSSNQSNTNDNNDTKSDNTNTETVKTDTVVETTKKTDTDDSAKLVTDIIVDEIDGAVPKYGDVEKIISSANLTASIGYSGVASEINELKTLLTETKTKSQELFDNIKRLLMDLLKQVTGYDVEIVDPDVNEDGITTPEKVNVSDEKIDIKTKAGFLDISKLTTSWKAKSSIKKADATFFKGIGYKVDSNGIVSMGSYDYDTTSGKLINRKTGGSIYVDYYIPKTMISDKDKLSKTNTITCLGTHGESGVGKHEGYGTLGDYKSDTILVLPKKNGTKYGRSYTQELNEVIDSTTFATVFTNQKKGCHNIIGGSSSGGGSALKAAAKSDIYDIAFSINYPPLIPSVTGGKAQPDDRLTESDLNKLNKKTLVFIESGGDDNVNYTERGLRVLSKTNPNVYYATNGRSSNIGNAHLLSSNFWNNFAQNYANSPYGRSGGKYCGHPACRGLMADVINSGMFAQNDYNKYA